MIGSLYWIGLVCSLLFLWQTQTALSEFGYVNWVLIGIFKIPSFFLILFHYFKRISNCSLRPSCLKIIPLESYPARKLSRPKPWVMSPDFFITTTYKTKSASLCCQKRTTVLELLLKHIWILTNWSFSVRSKSSWRC